jgi:hypothetical protein
LLVAAYFIATSSAFFKSAILPRVGQALNAQVTVSDASIHPFHEVVLRDLKVQTTGSEPLLSVPEVRARYSLRDIIGGNINVEDITLTSPTVTLVENPDGTSNLDPILKAQAGALGQTRPEHPVTPAKPLRVDFKNLALTGATVRNVKLYAGGNRDVAEISNLNVTLAGVKNAQAGKLSISADINVENHPPAATNALLQAKLDGAFDFSLNQDLKPASVQGHTRLDITRAGGTLSDLAALAARFDCDVTPTDVKQLALHFQKGGAPLGEVRVTGPFALAKREGRLSLEILSIDKQVLNLFGAKSGLDFGATVINSTNEIELAGAGAIISAAGDFAAAKLQLTRNQQTTPRLDLQAGYSLTVSNDAKTAVLRVLRLSGTEQGRALLHGGLTQPMTLAWGGASSTVGDSTLTLVITNLDFADWKPFLGDFCPEGHAEATLSVLAEQGGKQLTFGLGSRVENLTTVAGTNTIRNINLTLEASGKVADFERINLTSSKLAIAQKELALMTLAGSGTIEATNQAADLQFGLQADLAALLGAFPQPQASVSSGLIECNGRFKQTPNQAASHQSSPTQIVTGNLVMSNLTGHLGNVELRQFGSTVAFDASKTPSQINLSKFQISLTPTARATNQLQISGKIDMTRTNAIQGDLKLTGDSLDLTSYYDLFAGQQKAGQGKAAGSPPPQAGPVQEPAPISLPLRNFTAEANLRRLYLREVEVADLQFGANADGSRVVVNPFKLTLNGAPVSANLDLDLGVRGWKYTNSFSVMGVPLPPLVDSFEPERRGQLGGTVIIQTSLAGAGVNGASLQKNLSGQFDIVGTNLDLQLSNVHNPLLKGLISVIAVLPDLVRNPEAGLSSLVGGTDGQGGVKEDLNKSPLDLISLRGAAGAGGVDLQSALVRSAAFEAEAHGNIRLAPKLTNSTIEIPVAISLARPIAEKINLVPPNTPTNAAYARLPDFLTMKGTLGTPKEDINKVALAGVTLKGISSVVPAGSKAGQVLGGIGGILGARATPSTNAPSGANTNQPGQSPVNELLDLFKKPKK